MIARRKSNCITRIAVLTGALIFLGFVYFFGRRTTFPNYIDVPVTKYNVELNKGLVSLNKLLDYLLEKPRRVVGDLIFGIVMVEGQLSILAKHLKIKDRGVINATTIFYMDQKCKLIYNIYNPIRINPNGSEYHAPFMDYVVKLYLWEKDYPIVEGRLQEQSAASHGELKKQLSMREIDDLLYMGTPEEQDSDKCIVELFLPKLCGMSLNCNHLMTSDEEVHGYSLTHRLLYFQVAERLGCEKFKEFGDIQKRIQAFCSDILVEMYHIIDLGIPEDFRDLFLEQISLCGLEGFAEFLLPRFIEWAIDLQMPNGCFTSEKEITSMKHRKRVKREDGDLDEHCTMHITGLAAPFLAICIRAIVDYWSI